ncbi:MAG: hypothetical protein A4E32_01464 [Methanomassiliicoccales archaeon PtaU1.Bin124]|nr:MAG: hypothetical protein A4E32_01464 [Methanomassiliicoccales archaeon PtaU1.Bin124]
MLDRGSFSARLRPDINGLVIDQKIRVLDEMPVKKEHRAAGSGRKGFAQSSVHFDTYTPMTTNTTATTARMPRLNRAAASLP